MRYTMLFVIAAVGLAFGLVFDLVQSGFSVTQTTVPWGLGTAFLCVLFLTLLVSGEKRYEKRSKPTTSIDQEIPTVSTGSFDDRLERFAKNVEPGPSKSIVKFRMELWSALDLDECDRTPPKPIGLIRILLHRIKRILAGG